MADTPTPRLELIFAANVLVGPPLDCGDVGKGARRIVPITGGEFLGPSIRGKVLPGGADWQKFCAAMACRNWKRAIRCKPTTAR